MPKFCANLSMLYGEHAFLDRFDAAAADGFGGVEFLFPYAVPAGEIAARLKRNGLVQVLHNLPAGNWDAGERGIACDPDRADEFHAGVAQAIDYATALGCPQVNCLVGIPPAGADPARIRRTLVANLGRAARELGKARIRLLIEPVNGHDIPGFWLQRVEDAATLIEETGSDNIFIQYDIYHQQRSAGELVATFRRFRDRIAHVQVADNPGRGEPGTGEIGYGRIFAMLDDAGYQGCIGCEYRPAAGTSAGLGWRDTLARPTAGPEIAA